MVVTNLVHSPVQTPGFVVSNLAISVHWQLPKLCHMPQFWVIGKGIDTGMRWGRWPLHWRDRARDLDRSSFPQPCWVGGIQLLPGKECGIVKSPTMPPGGGAHKRKLWVGPWTGLSTYDDHYRLNFDVPDNVFQQPIVFNFGWDNLASY